MGNIVLVSIGSTVGLAALFAVILAVANSTLKVKEDPRIVGIEEILPGLNCGACGYAGCHAFAEALLKEKADTAGCLAGGKEVADGLSDLLGVCSRETIKKIAIVHCNADKEKRTKSTSYSGIKTCSAANLIKGVINCKYGCMGYGDCFKACPFGAIRMTGGLPEIIPGKCVACGKCVEACPRDIISLEDHDKDKAFVACNSEDKGPRVREICSKGCIACGICQKLSEGVFKIDENLARVDSELAKTKSVDWEKIISKCPTKVIVKQR